MSILRKKDTGVLYKLDIEKAYDQVDWNFFVKVMCRMGFGGKWVGWIKWCISTASFSVLLIGNPIGFFNSSRGLRQGDLLSPYLFILGMEVFSSLIHRAAAGGYLSGFSLRGKDGVIGQVTHPLFADDILVFCKESENQMASMSCILVWFEALSGLRINLDKSSILHVGKVDNINRLALELGCKVGSLPTDYLGLPLGVKHNSAVV